MSSRRPAPAARPDRADTVGLTFHVEAERRQFVKITAAELDVTMHRIGRRWLLLLERGLKSSDPRLRKLVVEYLTDQAGLLAGKESVLLTALLGEARAASAGVEQEKRS